MFDNMILSANSIPCVESTESIADIFGDGSCIAHYLFNDTLLDNNDYLHNGTAVNTVIYDQGKFEKALKSNGSGYVQTDIASTSYSVSMWVKRTSDATSHTSGGSAELLAGWYVGHYTIIAIGGEFKIQLLEHVNATNPVYSSGLIVPMDEWTHIYYYASDGYQKVVIGGTEVTANLLMDTAGPIPYEFNFRGHTDTITEDGLLQDNVRMFNRELTFDEVKVLAAENPYCSDPTPQDYIAYYPLTGTAEDKTGNYDGTENGGLLYVDDTISGSVASFDGIDDSVSTPLPLQNASAQFTVSLWFDAVTTGFLFGSSTYNSTDYVLISDVSVIYGLSTGEDSLGYTPVSGSRNHILVLFKGSANGFEVFLNGVSVGSKASTSFTGSVLPYYMGARNTEVGLADFFAGKASSFRMYNRLLTQQEITAIYNYERVTRPIPVDDGLSSFFPLAANSLDNYYNQFDGTDVNITYNGTDAAFNGTDSNIQIYNKNFFLSSPVGAVALKITPTNVANAGVILNAWPSTLINYIHILKIFPGGKLGVYKNHNGVTTVLETTSQVLQDGIEASVVYQNDGTGTDLIINGVSAPITVTTGTDNGNWFGDVPSLDRVNIGCQNLDSVLSGFFAGNIRDLRPYTRILSQTEIEELMI